MIDDVVHFSFCMLRQNEVGNVILFIVEHLFDYFIIYMRLFSAAMTGLGIYISEKTLNIIRQ